MLTNVPTKELYVMDLGVHMATMEEWNEDHNFGWQPANISILGYYTVVTQEDRDGGLYVAVYITNGEGDLKSLRVYGGKEMPTGHDYFTVEKTDELYQAAWWDGHDSATGTTYKDRKPTRVLYTAEDVRAARQEAYAHGKKEGQTNAADQLIRVANSIRRGASR